MPADYPPSYGTHQHVRHVIASHAGELSQARSVYEIAIRLMEILAHHGYDPSVGIVDGLPLEITCFLPDRGPADLPVSNLEMWKIPAMIGREFPELNAKGRRVTRPRGKT